VDCYICGKTHGPVCNTQYWETLALPLWVFDVVCFCVKAYSSASGRRSPRSTNAPSAILLQRGPGTGGRPELGNRLIDCPVVPEVAAEGGGSPEVEGGPEDWVGSDRGIGVARAGGQGDTPEGGARVDCVDANQDGTWGVVPDKEPEAAV
jgi:hypothetical protein